jgi:trans-aconitate methyltransferase
MRSTVTLTTYFETLYPGCVLSVQLGQNIRYLDRLVDRRTEILASLERIMYQNHATASRAVMSIHGERKVDSYTHYFDLLADLNIEIGKEYDNYVCRYMYIDVSK